MKINDSYNSILVAVQYKNFYTSISNELKNNELLKEKGFENFLESLPLDSGIQAVRVPGDKKNFAALIINPIRIQYEEANLKPNEVERVVDLMLKVNEKRTSLVPSTEKDNIEFLGIVVKATYELLDEDITVVKEKMKPEPSVVNTITLEKRSNFTDSDNWNYNTVFTFDFAKKTLAVMLDINDRFKDSKELSNLNEILNIINNKFSTLDIKNV